MHGAMLDVSNMVSSVLLLNTRAPHDSHQTVKWIDALSDNCQTRLCLLLQTAKDCIAQGCWGKLMMGNDVQNKWLVCAPTQHRFTACTHTAAVYWARQARIQDHHKAARL